MRPRFSLSPGAHERQLMARADNPLFPEDRRSVTAADVLSAQLRDQNELKAFMEDFQALVQRAVELEPNADSEVILKLKEDLDRAYETVCGLMGDLDEIRQAIRRLVTTIMSAVRKGAGNDAAALARLDDEDAARALHYRLLEHPLVADLLRADDLINADELLPTLLSAEPDAFAAALQLFTPEQLGQLIQDGHRLVQAAGDSRHPRLRDAAERLAEMERHAAALADDHTAN
ncbi:hypothetical protein [Thiohalobacter sp.]|uniref:hypothetical protein n=1 Tax=Thiohalobacter sp. TaxID=2025948 RepID=UPI00261433E1|nr:hypothetical protein [Thiohalobacter sp.]